MHVVYILCVTGDKRAVGLNGIHDSASKRVMTYIITHTIYDISIS